jgi:predicted amidohydrolase
MRKKAEEKEREYNWLEAARLYELELAPTESDAVSSPAETWERIGSCYNWASRQTENLEEFKKLRQLSVEGYQTATKLFQMEDNLKSEIKGAECTAKALYLCSWLASNASEKKETLDECRKFGKKALEGYEEAEEDLGYAESCNNLSLCLLDRLYVASDAGEKRIIVQEGIDYSNKSISALSKLENKNELLLAYSIASLLVWYAANISDQEEERGKLTQRSLSLSEKALELSKEVDNPYCIAMSRWAAVYSTLFFTEKIECALQYAKEMLQQGLIVRDNYLKGIACYLLSFVSDWKVLGEADPLKKKETCQEIIKYAEEAVTYLQLVSQDFFSAETYLFYAESYSSLASDVEVGVEEKRVLLSRAAEIGRKGLEHGIRSGSPDALGSILHALSKALHSCSKLESGRDKKVGLLEEALVHRRRYIEIVEKAFPSNDWVFGVGKYYAGLIETELTRLEIDENKRIALLKNAVLDMKDGVSHCRKWISAGPVPSLVVMVAGFEDMFGETLNELHLLTRDKEILTDAIGVFCSAAEKFKKVDLPSRVAESYWKAARNKDHLGKYQEASEIFEDAFENYEAAANKIHQFADFYLDYAAYMKAWSEIAKAKAAHKDEKYDVATQHFEKSADLLKQLGQWNYLSPYFQAWSLLEKAEDLSRKELSTESIEIFKEAASLFEKAKRTVEHTHAQLENIEAKEEKQIVSEMAEISGMREEYCMGRTAIEEAKVLDRHGDHAGSSRKYEFAAQGFQKAADSGNHELYQQELRPIICLCRAWQTMTRAEAESSPDLYLEASQLFDEAKKHSFSEKAKLLAMGHSRFCKALEAGTRFEDTRDPTLHLAATQHLESAANYYMKAGFQTAAEYAVATQRLFDGYIYMNNANKEADPEKKTRYFIIAEKILKTSAESYLAAKHSDKAEQVQKLLDKVTERRAMAASLSEILHAPTIASSTSSFVTPTSSDEKAVGLERFEHANIQGHLTVPEEVPMEEDLEIQLDLVNVAKNYGLLVRIDNLVPKGFRVTEAPTEHAVDDGSVDLGGKRCEPLKVESIKISAHATDFGIFKVSPQVIYVDEVGQFRTCNPEPARVKVLAPAIRFAEEGAKKKYGIVYRDLLKELPRPARNQCRVAIAQIGVSKEGDVLSELYEERSHGLFRLRQDKVEVVRSNVRKMIEIAHAREVNILLFPELTVDLNYSELLEDVTTLANAYDMYIIPGSYHNMETRKNISTAVGPDGILWLQEKHIPAVIHHEGKRFTEGIDTGVFPKKTIVCNTEFGRIAIIICRDFLDMDLRVELKNFEPPVDIVFNPAFTPVTADFRAAHFDARRSIYAYCFFANVAEFGDSFIYTPEKERVERTIQPREEGLIYKDVDVFNLRSERKKWEKEQKQFIQSTR